MKRALPLYSMFLILTANVAPAPPVSAESIGDRSNRQAYADAPSRNWVDRLITTPSSSTAHEYRLTTNSYQPGHSSSSTCTREEYREEYVPGTARSPGYINSWYDTVQVPCWRHRPSRPSPPIWQREPSPDGNECSEGAILGGILGGGAAAAISQGDGRWWAIPLGIVSGSVIGCDIDGG